MRVLVVGLDGASFNLLKPWMEDGQLPNLERLRRSGASGHLRSTLPPVTAPAWASLATGKNPGRHGLFDFSIPLEGSYSRRLVSSSSLREPTLWQLLSQEGRRVGLINVPLTYPPKALNGFIVSGLLSPNLNSGITYPPSLLSKILSEIGDYQIDLSMDRYGRGREVDFLKDLHHLTSLHKKTSLHLMQSCPWDFFMTVFIGGDRIQHAMWNYFDNQHPAFRKEKARRFGDAILHYYQQIDKYIGEVLRLVDDDTVIVVLSDHGFGALEKRIYVNSWLQDLGLLSLRLPDMASETGETSYDFISRSLEASVKAPKHAPSLGSCRIGDDERPVIFQPPPSEITYRLRLGPQPVLKFGITIHPDVWAPRYGAGVCFEILVSKGLRRRTLFSRYIDPKNRPQERRWHDFVIDLGEYSGDKVSITFKTSPDGYHNYAIWSRPIMVEKGYLDTAVSSFFQHWIAIKNETLASIDWEQTKAYSGHESEHGIHINLRGREPEGIVEPGDEYEDLRSFLIENLLRLTDPETDECVISEAFRREEVYDGPYVYRAPDVIYVPREYRYLGVDDLKPAHLFEPTREWEAGGTGYHRMEGVLLAAGKHIAKGKRVHSAKIIDLAPTILYLFGLAIPRSMEGSILTEMLDQAFVATNRPRWVEDNQRSLLLDSEGQAYSKEEAAEVARRLKGLGYLG